MEPILRERSRSWSLILYLGLMAAVAGLTGAAQAADLETDLSFSLESWFTYDDDV